MSEAQTSHPMRTVRLEKVTVNIGVGEAGERLVKAEGVLSKLAGQKPVRTKARDIQREWGIRRGQDIGVKVTLRGEGAVSFLKRAFYVRNNRLPAYSFDATGNLSFGVVDHTDFPDMKYDPETGIFGMDIAVTFSRPGARVRRRRVVPVSVGPHHRVARAEAQQFIRDTFSVEVA